MRETKFKKTEIGLIPDAWEIVSLGQLFDFKNGLNKGKDFFGYGTPIVNFTDVFNNPKMYQSTIKGLVSVTSNDIKSCNVHKGDVFFTRTSETPEEVGMSSVLLDELESAVFSGFVLRARPKTDLLDSEYSGVCMRSNTVRQQIIKSATYTTRALTSGAKLSEVLLPLPPLAEQRKIAKALSDVDGLISSLAKLIEKKQNIKTATMQQLLTGKKRLEGFTEPWVETKLSSFGCMLRGVSYKPEQSSSNPKPGFISLLRSNNIQNDSMLFTDCVYVDQSCISERQYMKNGDILVCTANGSKTLVGKTALFNSNEKYTFGAFMGVFRCFDDCCSSFVSYLMKSGSYKVQVADLLAGSAINNLKGSDVEDMGFLIPTDIAEQIAIANILTSMDNEISTLESKKAKYESIKKGMMQELLTGRIRLV